MSSWRPQSCVLQSCVSSLPVWAELSTLLCLLGVYRAVSSLPGPCWQHRGTQSCRRQQDKGASSCPVTETNEKKERIRLGRRNMDDKGRRENEDDTARRARKADSDTSFLSTLPRLGRGSDGHATQWRGRRDHRGKAGDQRGKPPTRHRAPRRGKARKGTRRCGCVLETHRPQPHVACLAARPPWASPARTAPAFAVRGSRGRGR